jgi:hypothetical protein
MLETSPQSSSLGSNRTGEIQAGRAPATLKPTADLSLTACLTIRFDGLDSSISCRAACRSSVADITGNSRTRTQLRSRNGRIRFNRQAPRGQTDAWCHIQMAGTASDSQTRFSSNSIARQDSLNEVEAKHPQYAEPNLQIYSLAKYETQVNVNARTCTAGACGGQEKRKGTTEAAPFSITCFSPCLCGEKVLSL